MIIAVITKQMQQQPSLQTYNHYILWLLWYDTHNIYRISKTIDYGKTYKGGNTRHHQENSARVSSKEQFWITI